MNPVDFWVEVVANSLEEHKVTVTPEQTLAVAKDVEMAHDNYGLAFYTPTHNPEREEIARLEHALQLERSKATCRECKGTGYQTTHGPVHSATSQCWRCRGEGRHA